MKYDDAIVRLCGDYDTLEQAKSCAQVIAYMGKTAEVYYYITPGKMTQYTVRTSGFIKPYATGPALYYMTRYLAEHGPDVVPQRLPESDSFIREQQEAMNVAPKSPIALEYAASMTDKADDRQTIKDARDLLDWLIRIVGSEPDATQSLKEFLGVAENRTNKVSAEERYAKVGLQSLFGDLAEEIYKTALDLQIDRITPQGFARWWRVQLGLQISIVQCKLSMLECLNTYDGPNPQL